MTSPDPAELAAAYPALCAAVRLTTRLQGQAPTRDKEDGSPVTVADYASQAVLLQALGPAFPDDGFISEESSTRLRQDPALLAAVTAEVGAVLEGATDDDVCAWIDSGQRPGRSGKRWLVDPLDGTKGFIAGVTFAVGIVRLDGDDPVFALIGCPHIGDDGQARVYGATREGAWHRPLDDLATPPTPVRVSALADPAGARLVESRVAKHSDHARQQRIYRQLGVTREPLRIDSMAKYALIASGQAEVFVRTPHPDQPDRKECSWDHAAGTLLVTAAGGRVSDLDGAPLDFAQPRLVANRGIMVSNGALHEAALGAIAAVDAPA